MKRTYLLLGLLLPLLLAFTFGGDGPVFTTGESVSADNMNEIDTALDALEARDSVAEHESVETINIILETEMDASSELRALMDDESGTGALLFADGAIGAATATTPSADDNDTSVATTAYVQTEILAQGLPTSGQTDDRVVKTSGTAGDTEASGVAIDASNNMDLPGDLTTGSGGTTDPTYFMFRDTDDAGYTECGALNGTFSCAIDADGVIDGTL